MKKFSAFLSEAERSFAAKEAEKLRLKHVGYGKYADASGNVTHFTKNGKLEKITGQEGGASTETPVNGEESNATLHGLAINEKNQSCFYNTHIFHDT